MMSFCSIALEVLGDCLSDSTYQTLSDGGMEHLCSVHGSFGQSEVRSMAKLSIALPVRLAIFVKDPKVQAQKHRSTEAQKLLPV